MKVLLSIRWNTSKAGLCFFYIPSAHSDFHQPWEKTHAEFPDRLASPLQIMTEGLSEVLHLEMNLDGRNIYGIFRTFEQYFMGKYRGYHKPIMIAGGVGLIDEIHVEKKNPNPVTMSYN